MPSWEPSTLQSSRTTPGSRGRARGSENKAYPSPFAVLFFLFAVQLSPAQVDGAASIPGEHALADVFVNGAHGGTIEFLVEESSGDPLIPVLTLRTILERTVKPEIVAKVTRGKIYVKGVDLEPLGVILEYTPSTLSLRFTVTPPAMTPQVLGATDPSALATSGVLFPPEAFSAMLGASLSLAPLYVLGAGSVPSARVELMLDPAVRLFGVVAEGGIDIGYPAVPWISVREARLSYDIPAIGARAAFGTISPVVVYFQSPVNLIGVSFASEASLPGGKRHRPSPMDDLLLQRPADISIEINGTTVRSLHLSPGSYRLIDLPFDTGLNSVTVHVAEEGSPARDVQLGIPYDAAILPPGQLEYALAAGVDRASLQSPFGYANISVGAVPTLELGVDASASGTAMLAGASVLWASPIGSLAASAAASTNGYAGRLDWRLSLSGYPYIPKLGAGIEYRSSGFAPPDDVAPAAPETAVETVTLSAQFSQPLPGGIGAFAAFGSARFGDGQLQSSAVSAGFFLHLASSASLSFSGGADWRLADGIQPRASISLSIVPQDMRTLQYRQDLVRGTESVEISNRFDQAGNLTLVAQEEGLASASENPRAARLSGTYRGAYADLSAAASYQAGSHAGPEEIALAFTASSAFAYAGGYFGMSSRLGDAFLFLVPSASLGTDTLVMQSRDGPAVVSEGGRPQLASGLNPYHAIAAIIEMPGSPPERRPRPETVRLAPTYRSGTVVEIRAAPALSFRGRLLDKKGVVITGRGGKVFRVDAPSVIAGQTFSDEKGIFECYGLDAGDFVVKWNDGSQSLFTIAGEGYLMIELGDVRASAPPRDGLK
jgi:outer membrane usher protein FimD/PapC